MKLTQDIRTYINKSVLCWLATASEDNIPNVSPKEIFTFYQTDSIIIANIASPQTAKNIKQNPNVCISFIDVFVQKGYQIKGWAKIIDKTSSDFSSMKDTLTVMTEGKFPFKTIIQIKINEVKSIIAPRYMLYPETTEKEQIESAKKQYGL